MHRPSEWIATVKKNREVGGGYRTLSLSLDRSFPKASAGAFVMLSVGREPEILLRRPMAIYDLQKTKSNVQMEILFGVVGRGTSQMARLQPGTQLSLLGPIGNQFSTPDQNESIVVVAGGIGVAPFRLWGRQLSVAQKKHVTVLFGFRDKSQKSLLKDFTSVGLHPILAIEGSGGDYRGTVVDLLRSTIQKKSFQKILTCGPTPMMDAVMALAKEQKIALEASLEAKMGCGLGVCLSCVTTFSPSDRPGQYSLVCQDGPVFRVTTTSMT